MVRCQGEERVGGDMPDSGSRKAVNCFECTGAEMICQLFSVPQM